MNMPRDLKELEVLYVEDEKDVGEANAQIFGFVFKGVDLAYDGKEGLKRFEDKQYDLIVSDIDMPVMDGITMAKKIREYDLEIPIILLSALDIKKLKDETKELNIYQILSKPFDYKEIFDHLVIY